MTQAAATALFTPEQDEILRGWTMRYPYPIMGLIEAMRSVQEWHRHVGPEAEDRLARLFKTTSAHVHEVATFFPAFTQRPAGRKRIGVCQGLSCALAGSAQAVARLESKLGIRCGETTSDGECSLEAMECLGACDHAPAVIVNEELQGAGSDTLLDEAAEGVLSQPHASVVGAPGPGAVLTRNFNEAALHQIDVYRRLGGYEGLKKALSLKPGQVTAEVKASNLRGLGGAGFATGMKWETVPPVDKVPGPRFVVANADESEPGCFKDRVLLERSPHQLLEGLLIASYAVGAHDAFIFIRGEYERQYRVLRRAIEEAEAAGLMGDKILGTGFTCRIGVMRGAGAYISGLDTALLETMEGKKAWPRQPPPFPTARGLMGQPTVVNNVETLSMLPHVLARGGEWFKGLGTDKCGGTALFSVSGHVRRPGVYEFPMGTPLRAVIEAAGGLREGHRLKAVIPGGASTPVLSAAEVDVPMDFESLRAVGSFLGAGGVIVLDETADMVAVAHNIERFLSHESCGQCTPCREGSEWTVRILGRMLSGRGEADDLPKLTRIGENITGKVICALGDTVGVVTRGFMRKFPEDFKAVAGGSHG